MMIDVMTDIIFHLSSGVFIGEMGRMMIDDRCNSLKSYTMDISKKREEKEEERGGYRRVGEGRDHIYHHSSNGFFREK